MLFLLSAPAAARPSAKAEFGKGQKAFASGRYSEALVAYLEAYRLEARPAFLFNIAQCYRRLDDHAQAASYFKQYNASFPAGKVPNGAMVRELLAEVEVKAADAQRRQEVAAALAAIEAAREKAAADEELRRVAREEEEEARKQSLAAAAAAAARAAAARPAPWVPTEAPPPPSSSIAGKWWFWAGIGVVVAGAAGTAAYVGTRPQPRGATLEAADFR